MDAPFPYYGGKKRIAANIWERFGNPNRYLEPFAGSLAVLLARAEPCRTEIVSDTDGYIVNAWRALARDPEACAFHADYPSLHHDLTARQHTLIKWHLTDSSKLLDDANYFDAQIAGWWLWGVSNWIGGNYAVLRPNKNLIDRSPWMNSSGGGRGVKTQRDNFNVGDGRPGPRGGGGTGINAQRTQFPVSDKRPIVHDGAQGVQAMRKQYPVRDGRPIVQAMGTGHGINAKTTKYPVYDKIPILHPQGRGHGINALTTAYPVHDKRPLVQPQGRGHGINAQTTTYPDSDAIQRDSLTSSRVHGIFPVNEPLYEYFHALATRLKRVVTLNRPFSSFTSPTLLGKSADLKPDTAIFLDPPYRTSTGRDSTIYQSDVDSTSEDVAVEAYAWAIANGDEFKIAYCCHEGDFPIPPNWSFTISEFTGIRKQSRRQTQRDMVMFSPKCLHAQQRSLF